MTDTIDRFAEPWSPQFEERKPAQPTITRDGIVSFIKANEHRSNPGARGLFGEALHTNGTCKYFEDDEDVDPTTPSCVIGNVLALAGITPSNYRILNVGASSLFIDLGFGTDIIFEVGVGDFAGLVQNYADRGYAWGTALQLALIAEAA